MNRAAEPREVVIDLWLTNAGLTGAELDELRSKDLRRGKCLLTGDECRVERGLIKLTLPPESARLFKLE